MAKILLIDDDRDMLDSLSIILESADHEVAVKLDTDDLEAAVAEIDPDLIILDVMFPEDPQAGFAAARLLRSNERLARIPLLILSAINQRTNLAFGFSAADISDDFMPVDDFLEKPIEPKVLLEKVTALLDA